MPAGALASGILGTPALGGSGDLAGKGSRRVPKSISTSIGVIIFIVIVVLLFFICNIIIIVTILIIEIISIVTIFITLVTKSHDPFSKLVGDFQKPKPQRGSPKLKGSRSLQTLSSKPHNPLNIGALIIRIGFQVYYTRVIPRTPPPPKKKKKREPRTQDPPTVEAQKLETP